MSTSDSTDVSGKSTEARATPRMIKRYSNRKLYDTVESRYVTLPQIALLLRNGEDVKIIDNNSKEDLTSVTLAQILYEEEKRQSRSLPMAALKDLIHTSGERINQFLREGPMGKILRKDEASGEAVEAASTVAAPVVVPEPVAEPAKVAEGPGKFEKLVEQSRASFAEWSAAVDDRARKVVEAVSPAAQIEKLTNEVRKLEKRVAELEAHQDTRRTKE
ncbi:MAG: polyhydroxyalkanoate synthesis regulator DNA-binding domain-containing protein [Deltaproteobacteria bacterium]|nr:polyhydroxyalkanoate synthesis regulator DNA-binding domain-containing protein [Deltaproteobacteria bacterium]